MYKKFEELKMSKGLSNAFQNELNKVENFENCSSKEEYSPVFSHYPSMRKEHLKS